MHAVGAAAAASNKDAHGDVPKGAGAEMDVEPPADAELCWQQRELENRLRQVRGELGAQTARHRKVNLTSSEAMTKMAAVLQAAAACAAEEAGEVFATGDAGGFRESMNVSLCCLQTET